MNRMLMSRLVCVAISLGVSFSSVGQPRFAKIFSDHAVLQQGEPIPIWGFGSGSGVSLQVRFGETVVKAHSDRVGNWNALLPAHSAKAEGRTLALLKDGAAVKELRDVVVGEVWLAAGQSNMQWPMRQVAKKLPEAKEWVASSRLPDIRLRRINDPVLKNREKWARDLASHGEWMSMSPDSVMGFSAVAGVFARELHEARNVPVGIIDVSWGGKPIEPFISPSMFLRPPLKPIRVLAEAGRLDELAKMEGGVIIRNPEGHPGAIFKARISPLVRYRLKGFIWYQAESNCGRGEDPRGYRFKQKALIQGWRALWGNPKMPMYYVQLPSFPGATGWIRMREEQRLALSVPHTGMAVAVDVRGEGIHPPDKLSVGRRLARLALAKTYGVGGDEVGGPRYQRHEITGDQVKVHFSNVGDGLMIGDKTGVERARPTEDRRLNWFELADAQGTWHSAQARIDGNTVIVSSETVSRPVAVRYACQVQPQGGNLYNRAGYPASPFCSDLKLLPWEDHGAHNGR